MVAILETRPLAGVGFDGDNSSVNDEPDYLVERRQSQSVSIWKGFALGNEGWQAGVTGPSFDADNSDGVGTVC